MRKSIHSESQAVLSDLLRALRADAGLRQQDVAEKLGKPQSFVAKYERGERQLDIIEFIEVVRALDADPVRVFKAIVALNTDQPVTSRRR